MHQVLRFDLAISVSLFVFEFLLKELFKFRRSFRLHLYLTREWIRHDGFRRAILPSEGIVYTFDVLNLSIVVIFKSQWLWCDVRVPLLQRYQLGMLEHLVLERLPFLRLVTTEFLDVTGLKLVQELLFNSILACMR